MAESSSSDMQSRLKVVFNGIKNTADSVQRQQADVRLVAVSKFQPIETVKTAYDLGIHHFGENYANELKTKADALKECCPNIKWHYIGGIQTKQLKQILKVPNLWCIETLSSIKHAEVCDKLWSSVNNKLNVMIQVNTSGEAQKSGCSPENVRELADFIKANCNNLNLLGMMTIGSAAASYNSSEENHDFESLIQCRDAIDKTLELSMGMSADYQLAVKMGSTNIRVGSTIFGPRPLKIG